MGKFFGYQERVFDIIDSFSCLDGSVLAFAKGLFVDSGINSMYPSNAAICCLNVANEYLNGSPLKTFWNDVMYFMHTSEERKRKPTFGRKIYRNILKNSEKFKVNLEKHKRAVEVMFSGSEIVYKEDERSLSQA